MRLLDFGLARMDEAETLTAVGDIPGTLAYISPERLKGASGAPAADVWARRGAALGGARRLRTRSGAARSRDGAGDRGGRAAARSPCGPTCRRRCIVVRRPRADAEPGAAVRAPASWPRRSRHAHTRRKPTGGAAARRSAQVRSVRPALHGSAPRRSPRSPPRPEHAAARSTRRAGPLGLAALAAALAFARPRLGLVARARRAGAPARQRLARARARSMPALAAGWLALMWRSRAAASSSRSGRCSHRSARSALAAAARSQGAPGALAPRAHRPRQPCSWPPSSRASRGVAAAVHRRAPRRSGWASRGSDASRTRRRRALARAARRTRRVGSLAALALAAVALALPYARARGRWGIAALRRGDALAHAPRPCRPRPRCRSCSPPGSPVRRSLCAALRR